MNETSAGSVWTLRLATTAVLMAICTFGQTPVIASVATIVIMDPKAPRPEKSTWSTVRARCCVVLTARSNRFGSSGPGPRWGYPSLRAVDLRIDLGQIPSTGHGGQTVDERRR